MDTKRYFFLKRLNGVLGLHDHFVSTKIFTLIMNSMFTRGPIYYEESGYCLDMLNGVC